MPIIQPILEIVAAIAAIVASLFLGKEAVKWIQAYRTNRQKSEVSEAREDAQSINQAANKESDRLKAIDGR
jgi:hypothetical protein